MLGMYIGTSPCLVSSVGHCSCYCVFLSDVALCLSLVYYGRSCIPRRVHQTLPRAEQNTEQKKTTQYRGPGIRESGLDQTTQNETTAKPGELNRLDKDTNGTAIKNQAVPEPDRELVVFP